MRWLEIIKLRTVENRDGLLEEVLRSLAKTGQCSGLKEVKTYRHAALGTDLSMHLLWESDRPDQHGTGLGLHLAQALKEFGLTDHSIWIEDER